MTSRVRPIAFKPISLTLVLGLAFGLAYVPTIWANEPAIEGINDGATEAAIDSPPPEASIHTNPTSDAPDPELDERTAEADANVDLAFGAFQRGYYLTALELALPRAQLG
ncbi:MAG: hypothetical protein AAGH82_11430, partial [Pseudomonadota bacterium]